MKPYLRSKPKRPVAGFTLIEVLVIIIIIGILFAIAAPGWEAFLSRQRISSGREQVLQVLRQAQSEARTTRTPRVVVFDVNPSNGIPRVAYARFSSASAYPVPLNSVSNWKSLGNDIPSNALRMRTNTTANQIVFDGNGAVALPTSLVNVPANQFAALPNSSEQGFAVTVSSGRVPAAQTDTRRCVIVQTLLGSTRLAEGANCP
jgi:Tfp pilus assembly protein FimT